MEILFTSDFNNQPCQKTYLKSIATFRQNGRILLNGRVDLDYYDCTPDEEETRILVNGMALTKGQRNHGHGEKLICSLFRLTPGPGLVVKMAEWNKYMKSYNGNKHREREARSRPAKRKKPPAKPSSVPSFNVIHQNLPGMWATPQSTGLYIEQLIKRYHPAILFLTEVNPDKMVEPNVPGLTDYRYVKGTLNGKDNIRICALVKVTVKFEVEELNVQVPSVCIKIGKWRFVAIYREWRWGADPATADRRDLELIRLKTFVRWWKKQKGKTLILGDFNFDPNDPVTTHQKTLNGIRDYVEAEITDRGWKQLMQEITRSQKGDTPSLLDHIYVNEEDFVEHIFRENITGTDHYAVGVKVRLEIPVYQANSFITRNLKNIPKGEFERVFTSSRLYEIYQEETVDGTLDCLEFKVMRTLNIVAPEVTCVTRPHYARWMTPELKVKVSRRNAMRKKAETTRKVEDWKIFKGYQKVLMKEMREARQNSFKEDMDVKCAKKRWKIVKQHAGLGKKQGGNIELQIDGELVDDPKKVAHELNNYFKYKVVNLRKDLRCSVEESLEYTEEYMEDKEVETFEFHQVSRKHVKNVIKNLANTGAKGRDGIPTQVLKKYSNVLTGPITHLINLSIYWGRYPSKWKEGIITPLPKGGNQTESKNWRPICITQRAQKF